MKITTRQLRRFIREAIDPRELEEPLGGWAGDALHNDPDYAHHTDTHQQGRSSKDIMDELNQLGWSEELLSAVGTPPGAYGDNTDPATRAVQEKEYDALMSDPKVAALVKAYSEARTAEYDHGRTQHDKEEYSDWEPKHRTPHDPYGRRR
jgi:hypothetical protein